MTLPSILAMAGGLAILAWLPQPKDRRRATVTTSAGAFLFGIGLVGLIMGLMPAVA